MGRRALCLRSLRSCLRWQFFQQSGLLEFDSLGNIETFPLVIGPVMISFGTYLICVQSVDQLLFLVHVEGALEGLPLCSIEGHLLHCCDWLSNTTSVTVEHFSIWFWRGRIPGRRPRLRVSLVHKARASISAFNHGLSQGRLTFWSNVTESHILFLRWLMNHGLIH